MAKNITPATTPAPEPATVVLSWAADTPVRLASRRDPNASDTAQPTLDELVEGQIAADCGLSHTSGELEDLESLCRMLAENLDSDARVDRLRNALSVVAERLEDIRFKLDEDSEAIVPLHNLAAWYHRSVSAQGGAR